MKRKDNIWNKTFSTLKMVNGFLFNHVGAYIIIVVCTLLVGFSVDSNAQGPGAGWPYYRLITLSPVTPAANFQVQVTLSTGQYTNMKADGSDLRFYDNNDLNCDYWIESWNASGTSIIWVKVASSGASWLRMYYGNAGAVAASNGDNTFDFFDDFSSALGSKWTTSGTVTQSGTVVTLSNTNGTTAATLSNTNPFSPASTSFLLETKHYGVGYNRNRFYATNTSGGGSPIAVGDYGYFSSQATAQTSAQVFWGTFPGSTSVSNNTNYLTQWRITDGSTYNWYTYPYSTFYTTGATVANGSRTTTYGSNIRYISITITEVANTSSIIDWVRVRQYTASEPASIVLSQVSTASQLAAYSANTTFTVPSCVTSVTIRAWGAGGGGGGASDNRIGGNGGAGGFVQATIAVTPKEILQVFVGSGGAGGGRNTDGSYNAGNGGGGGGYTGLFRSTTPLVVIGAGGGGGGGNGDGSSSNVAGSPAGAGGGTSGVSGSGNGSTTGGGSGTQSSGGSGGASSGTTGASLQGGRGGSQLGTFGTIAINNGGQGGFATNSGSNRRPGGGGGGAGYFGGGGGGYANARYNGGAGGGGGSSFTIAGATSVTNSAGNGINPHNTTNPFYAGNAGRGGAGGTTGNNGSPGNSGLLVITYEYATPPTFTITKTDITCFNAGDGTITVNASGGSGTYEYSKDGGLNWQSNNEFMGLLPGNYQIVIKDSNGCLQTNCE